MAAAATPHPMPPHIARGTPSQGAHPADLERPQGQLPDRAPAARTRAGQGPLRFGQARQTRCQICLVQPAAPQVDRAPPALLGGLGEPLAVLHHLAPGLAQELPVLL